MEDIPLILTLLDKSIRQFTLYGREHPQTQLALRDLMARLDEYLTNVGRLELTVKRTELEWKGEAVFRMEKRENNYLQQMYLDGIRRLGFAREITPEELKDFVQVLSRDPGVYESQEDDTVTLFWKKAFRHLFYQTVDVYGGDLVAMFQNNLSEEDMTKEEMDERNYARHFVEKLVAAEPSPGAESVPARAPAKPLPEVPLFHFEVTSENGDRIRKEAQETGIRDFHPELRTVFCEVLETEGESEDLPPLVAAYLAIVAGFVEEGKPTLAAEWMTELRIVETFLAGSPTASAIFDREIDRAFPSEMFTALGKQFAHAFPGTPEEWIAFFRPLKSTAAPIVIELLTHLPQETLHATFTDFLLSDIPGETELYRSQLTSPNWMMIRDMVRILGKLLSGKDLVDALNRVAAHPHPEIRLEVLRVAGPIPGESTHELLRRGLMDSNADVRNAALRFVGQHRDPYFAKPLAKLANADSFLERDPVEKKRWMITLGRCAGTAALPFLEQVLDRVGSTDPEIEVRVAALHGLAEIPDPRAHKALQNAASPLFGSREVKKTARHLLERKTPPKEKDPK
ncbi:MAG: HEAT repeat domain-containing protein [Pseudomonadota bacterium]